MLNPLILRLSIRVGTAVPHSAMRELVRQPLAHLARAANLC